MNLSKILFISVFSGTLVLASSSTLAAKKIIWQDGANVFVKYAKQGKANSGGNDHPVKLDANEIRTVLDLIRMQEDLEPVFSSEQTNSLGQYLAKGLNDANPNQDIIFALEKSDGSASEFFKSDQFYVAGRVFYVNNKLNIIIGDHDRPRNAAYEAAVDPTHVGIVHYNFNHGSRSKASKGFRHATVAVRGFEHQQLNNLPRLDWLKIDVRTAIDAVVDETKQLKQAEIAKKRQELKEILGVETTRQISEEKPKVNMPEMPVATPAKTARSLEERFTTLINLKNKGLISEQEYLAKRQQLLDEL